MTEIDGLPEQMAMFDKKARQYDVIDLFIFSLYNFFTFALGLGLGFLMWGMK
jgi:hypothetical protein